MTHLLELRAGELRATIAPTVGGSVARFDYGEQPLFRPAPDGADDVLAMGCFPLVPYANRIRGGRFMCFGREVVLAPNMAGDPSPLHGQGWLAEWAVVGRDDRQVELEYRHEPDEWPWRYVARQEFALDEEGLSITLDCRNLSAEPMPAGLALHPYYPCDTRTRIDAQVTHAWTVDGQVLPVARVPAEGRYALHERAICGQGLDNGFDGWNGRALIDWGEGVALELSSPDATRMQIFSPATGGFFAGEPVQNANCALNEPEERWSELGITLLREGEALVHQARFAILVG